ncbi:MAG: c-type cytochrome, partial [Chloroflexota bacterium]|nr:c-type cytochrome [Chloroflexota bacterium]
GVHFWPDIIYKDLLMTFGLFLLLVGLATFMGVALDPKADPSDSTYIPRPEWYFLFLFEFLKYVPGKIEWVGTIVIPGIAVAALFLLPFYDKSPVRYWKKRKIAISIMSAIVLTMVGLTVQAVATAPEQEEVAVASSINEQVVLGQDLYSVQCVECHGPDGKGGEILGVEGLEGVTVKSISSQDEMYTRSDETLFAIANYGQQDLGMPPYGLAYGGPLSKAELEAIVAFMRYTWDDRVELPAEASAANAAPTFEEGKVPSYEGEISKIVMRNCVSCHRPGKVNNNYLMESYQDMLTTGDNADKNLIAGDLNNYFFLTLTGNPILDANGNVLIHQMPLTGLLKEEYIKLFEVWILNGMPETIAEAEALSVTPEP